MNDLAHSSTSLSGTGWIGNWSPGIGDPDLISWLIVMLYALGTWQCYRIATMHSSKLRPREKAIWWTLAFGLLALGINKQLDLQTALIEIGRIYAEQQGWYEKRRQVQMYFTYGIAAFAGMVTISLLLLARQAPLATQLALAGITCLLSFIVIRAAEFNHINLSLDYVILGLKMKWIVEIIGICVIIANARQRLKM